VLSSTLGLEPETPLGHAYLVPYRNNKTGQKEAQFIIGYKGLADLMYRSGKVESIEAHAVYENDDFKFELGSNSYISHKPKLTGDRGKILCAYAVVHVKGSSKPVIEIVGQAEIDLAKSKSMSANSDYSPWNQFPAEMWKKTAVRRIAKLLPLSIENQNVAIAIEHDTRADLGLTQELPPELAEIAPEDEIDTTSKTDKLADEVEKKNNTSTEPPSGEPQRQDITANQAKAIEKMAKRALKDGVIEQAEYDTTIEEIPNLSMNDASTRIKSLSELLDNK